MITLHFWSIIWNGQFTVAISIKCLCLCLFRKRSTIYMKVYVITLKTNLEGENNNKMFDGVGNEFQSQNIVFGILLQKKSI